MGLRHRGSPTPPPAPRYEHPSEPAEEQAATPAAALTPPSLLSEAASSCNRARHRRLTGRRAPGGSPLTGLHSSTGQAAPRPRRRHTAGDGRAPQQPPPQRDVAPGHADPATPGLPPPPPRMRQSRTRAGRTPPACGLKPAITYGARLLASEPSSRACGQWPAGLRRGGALTGSTPSQPWAEPLGRAAGLRRRGEAPPLPGGRPRCACARGRAGGAEAVGWGVARRGVAGACGRGEPPGAARRPTGCCPAAAPRGESP